MEYERYGDTSCNWCTWNDSLSLVRGLEAWEIGGRAEIIQTTTLSRSARILRRVMET